MGHTGFQAWQLNLGRAMPRTGYANQRPSVNAQLSIEIQRNKELTAKLYSLRGETPPDANDGGSDYSAMPEPKEGDRRRPWEVYSSMGGVDSLFSGLSKRTPTGGFFTS